MKLASIHLGKLQARVNAVGKVDQLVECCNGPDGASAVAQVMFT